MSSKFKHVDLIQEYAILTVTKGKEEAAKELPGAQEHISQCIECLDRYEKLVERFKGMARFG